MEVVLHTTLTPKSFIIQDAKLKAKSPMFIRIGSGGKRSDAIFFSRSAARAFNIKQFDKVAVNYTDKEVWLFKKEDGFIISVDKKHNTRICDTSLTKWFVKRFKGKVPFRLTVVMSNECLYIK